MKHIGESESAFRRASSKAVALFCLLAIVIFAMPVGAQRVTTRGSRAAKGTLESSDNLQNAVLATATAYAYSPETDSLYSFNTATPGTVTPIPLVGIDGAGFEVLEFIDFRPSNGVLYAVATHPTTGSRVVTVNVSTGVVATAGAVSSLAGLFYGGDFNPVVDLIRHVSRTGGNRRLSPTGTVTTDSNLAYAAGDPNFGQVPSVVHVAYTNNFAGATSTTLYGIDVGPGGVNAREARLVTIGSVGGSPVSPNTGQLFTVGSLGVFAGNYGGFDIAAGTGIAYAVLLVDGFPTLYTINLTTGAATLVGVVAVDGARIDGLSIGAGSATTDLTITKSDNFSTYVPGSVRPYTIVASNAGPDPVSGAIVTDNISAQFTAFSWTCSGTNGGTCPASGTGSISAQVNLPVGASVTFQLQATVSPSATGNLQNTANITAPAGVTDSSPGNSSATDTNTLLTTAAGVMVSGRVMTPDGRGLRGARVTAINSDGVRISAITSTLGYYTFEDVEPDTYILSVTSRVYRFDPRTVRVTDSLTEVDFMGIE